MLGTKDGPKFNHKKGIALTALNNKRKEALERQAQYAALPLEEKLARAGAKEKAKLLAKPIKELNKIHQETKSKKQ
jgi:hypothetical protein